MSNFVKVEVGRRSAWLMGPGNIVVPALKLAQSPRQFDDVRRCWMVPVAYVSDFLAALEYRVGGEAEVCDVDR